MFLEGKITILLIQNTERDGCISLTPTIVCVYMLPCGCTIVRWLFCKNTYDVIIMLTPATLLNTIIQAKHGRLSES